MSSIIWDFALLAYHYISGLAQAHVEYPAENALLRPRILWVKTILNETKDLQGEIFVNMNLNSDRPFFRERV